MKPMRFIFFLSFLFVAIKFVYAEPDDDSFFDKTVIDLLRDKISDDRITVEPNYVSKSKINTVRINQDKVKAITVERFDGKSSSFLLNILYLDGSSESLSGKYVSYVEVPVAARYIKFGEIIQSSDLNNLKVKLDTIKNSDINSTLEVVGMQAKKYIAAGSVIKKADVTNPPVIKNNDPVNIIYSSGAINLKTSGTALGAGAVGDMVKVKNGTSGIVLLGQIINKNTVQVSGSNNE
jgi:flagella basal body P-ring formation protein FlgA